MNELVPKLQFLSPSMIDKYAQRIPNWGPLGYLAYKRTYARELEREGRTEEWHETITRVVEGLFEHQAEHASRTRIPFTMKKAREHAEIMYDRIFTFKFLPPGRGLWMMGTDYVRERGSAALNNCAFISTANINDDFSYPFTFLMDMSMLGVGVGFDTDGEAKVIIQKPQYTDQPFIVEDSREGWVALLKTVLDAFVGKGAIPLYRDYRKVRDAGTPLRGFGGTSSGYKPLEYLVQDLLMILSTDHPTPIRTDQLVDIGNAIGKCVVSGNVRRSAEIVLSRPGDENFLRLKQQSGGRYINNRYINLVPDYAIMDNKDHFSYGPDSWRWASNNSIKAELGMNYKPYTDYLIESGDGDPGFVWMENMRNYSRMIDPPDYKDKLVVGINPCSEQTLESGELCCLVETFPSLHSDAKEYYESLKYAYMYAKTVTLIPTHHDRTNAIMMKNRRIGTSMSGVYDAIGKFGFHRVKEEFANKGYEYIHHLDEVYSNWFCVPRSIKTTSVKPSGTVSLLPGVSPGVHPPHSQYYIRRMRLADTSELVSQLEAAGYVIEADVATPNTAIVEIPVFEKHFVRGKDEVSMWEQIAMAAMMQKYWADNSVSVTVSYDEKTEAHQILPALEHFQYQLKAVSFLPKRDKAYKQMPYESITVDQYQAMIGRIQPLRLTGSRNESVERFCDGESCDIKLPGVTAEI